MLLRRKISLSFMILYTVLLLSIMLIVNLIYHSIMYTQIQERISYEEKLVMQQLERFEASINSCCNNMILSLNMGIRSGNGASGFSGYSRTERNKMFKESVSMNAMMFNDINRISVVLSSGELYSKSKDNLRDDIGINPELYKHLNEEGVGTSGTWFYELGKQYGSTAGNISYIKSLRDILTNQEVGFIIVGIDSQSLQALYNPQNTSGYISYGVFTREGLQLAPVMEEERETSERLQKASEMNNGKSDIQTLRIGGRSYYSKKTPLNREWVLVSLTDRQAAMAGANVMTVGILLVGFSVMILSSLIITFIAKRISDPIQKVARHMVYCKNGLPDELPPSGGHDEISILTENFNHMIQRNRELLDNVQKEMKQKRHYELALLQSQIKPHFLYNTLDAAYCLSNGSQNEEAKKILKLLADYYRMVLNQGSEWISVKKELESVENYLKIQQIRYNGLFEYEIDVSTEIMQMKIPKLTLQPLVENAIYHGIKPGGKEGRIRVAGGMQGDWVVIKVWDNGVGFPKEKFHTLIREANTEAQDNSFGLKNCSDRLRLFYGEKSHLDLDSSEEYGTTLSICIYI